MTFSTATIQMLFSLIAINVVAQNNSNLLTDHEWLSTSTGFHKHYLFQFSQGKIESEFDRSGWRRYILKNGQIIIYTNDSLTHKYSYDPVSKESTIDKSIYDSALFKINKLDTDSLILEPITLRARELSYFLNRETFRKDSTSLINPRMVKFYSRELSYKKFEFDSLVLNYTKRTITIDHKGNYKLQQEDGRKPKIRVINRKQLDTLVKLINESNIEYFKSATVFDNRVDIEGTRTWKKLVLAITNKDGSIQIKTDYKDVPWTIKPLVNFIEGIK